MSKFELKNNSYFRLSNKTSKTINNNIITDELAVEFLQINKDRIKLFSKYPEDWETMLKGNSEEKIELTEKQKEDKKHLMTFKMKELKETYPNISPGFGQSKEAFVEKIITQSEDTND